MPAAQDAIVIIPRECFHWRPQVRFMETFPTRAAALTYAFQQDCNLIVENNEGDSPQFDVMQDPDGSSTAGLDLVLLKTEDVLIEPPAAGWTALMLGTFGDLAKRLATLVTVLYARQIVPLSRRAAAVAIKCVQEVAPLARRAAAVAGRSVREVAPLARRVDVVADAYLGEAVPFFLRAVAFAGLYIREIAPILRDVAAKCWSESKSVTRRHRRMTVAPRPSSSLSFAGRSHQDSNFCVARLSMHSSKITASAKQVPPL